MRPLTPRQEEVLRLIKTTMSDTGMPPTRAEIARELGFKSANAAEEHLKALARKGVIEILPGTSRGIRVIGGIEDEAEETGLPLIGRVAAGEPILAQAHVEAHFQLDPGMFNPSADFLLRVSGESMKDIGILDGDLLAVKSMTDARNGQVIVARVEEDVTVKRFERVGDTILLHAENEAFAPIKVDLATQNFSVEGLAVGVIRSNSWM